MTEMASTPKHTIDRFAIGMVWRTRDGRELVIVDRRDDMVKLRDIKDGAAWRRLPRTQLEDEAALVRWATQAEIQRIMGVDNLMEIGSPAAETKPEPADGANDAGVHVALDPFWVGVLVSSASALLDRTKATDETQVLRDNINIAIRQLVNK